MDQPVNSTVTHPFDRAHHLIAFLFVEDRRSLVQGDLGIGVHADDKVITERYRREYSE